MPIFEAAAKLARPVRGRDKISTLTLGMSDTVDAATPAAAALKWIWRLKPDERAAVLEVVVWAPKRHPHLPLYDGAPVLFRREGGRLIEVQR